MDERRGVPNFIWVNQSRVLASPHSTAEDSARWYLSQFSDLYRLPRGAFDTMYVSDVHDLNRTGTIVVFKQRVDGVEVVNNALKFLMKADQTLVAISGSLHDKATPQSLVFAVSAERALANAFGDMYEIDVSHAEVTNLGYSKAEYTYYHLEPHGSMLAQDLALTDPVRIKPVVYPMPNELVPGYYVEIMAGQKYAQTSDVYGYIIAADDGRVLSRQNLVHDDTFNYRVFADTTGFLTPMDGPVGEFTPHPTGVPDGFEPPFALPNMIAMEAFNSLNDPWLPSGATETTGNNVEAYADISGNDGFDAQDVRAITTSPDTFDYTYDTLLAPDANLDQRMASVTDLFYVTNWLHDYYYDSGFTEATGTGQEDNFGRGGVDGDSMKAEGQDQGGRNNANMSTPADGARPRMQMFVWDGRQVAGVDAQAPLNQSFEAGGAGWGLQAFDFTLPAVVADDGDDVNSTSVTDACEPLVNGGAVSGNIALVDRGSCSFVEKALNVENAGGLGIIVMNNAPGSGFIQMGGTGTVAIAGQMISFEDGQILRNALPVDVRMHRQVEVDRDGTIDNQIIAHEWGHYWHRRLQVCGSQQCGAQSEGWGDFVALHMTARDGDDFDGAYAMAGYSTITRDNSFYFGIRRTTYSANPDINLLSFRHISNGEPLPTGPTFRPNGQPNSQVHASGEVWCTTMWQGYRAILARTEGANPAYDFEEARRRMANYTTGGLLFSPASSTYTETSDSILAVAATADVDDFLVLADAYARRGLGTCAVAPDRFSTTFAGVVEAFDVSADMQIIDVLGVNDSIISCDSDGVLDGGETGQLRITVANNGAVPLVGTQVSVSSSDPNLVFPTPEITVGSIATFGQQTAALEVSLLDNLSSLSTTDLTISLTNPTTCEGFVERTVVDLVNFDSVPTQLDNVENPQVSWNEFVGSGAPDTWGRTADPQLTGNHVWYGIDQGSPTDASIESPLLSVSGNAELILEFDHRYQFEQDPSTNWDGGVIEISLDGGQNWEDVNSYVTPSYGGVLTDVSGNVLGNREAFVGQSPSYPNMLPEVLNFGQQFPGAQIKFRFRIGTDAAVSDIGWELDNIRVSGINNQPFKDITDDEGVCNGVPNAFAGLDQTVAPLRNVVLSGELSEDPDGDELTYRWEQVAGPEVLEPREGVIVNFMAPETEEQVTLTFALTVTDGVGSAMDTVDVVVVPNDPTTNPNPNPGPIDPDDEGNVDAGCCQTGDSTPGSGTLALMLLVAFGLVQITRRRRED